MNNLHLANLTVDTAPAGLLTFMPYIFEVDGLYIGSLEPFGDAFKEAKTWASFKHCPIYRIDHKGTDKEAVMVYCKAGVMMNADGVNADHIQIF